MKDCYLEDDVAVALVKLAMESFFNLHGHKVLYLPHGYPWNLKRGGKEEIRVCIQQQNLIYTFFITHAWELPVDVTAQLRDLISLVPCLKALIGC